jgi:hypothetical protein
MDVITFCSLYVAGIVFFIVVFLFGELPLFAGTPLPYLQWLISAAPCEALCWAVNRTCGARGAWALDAAFAVCFQRYNPTLQLLYLGLVFCGYYIYCSEVFALLPQPYAPLWHQCVPAARLCSLC